MTISIANAVVLFLASAGASLFGTALMVRIAPRLGLVDRPNERSSHTRVTPRGGGAAMVVVGSIVILTLVPLEQRELVALIPPFLLVAMVGLMDDFRGLSSLPRLIVHVASVVWLLWWMGGTPELGWTALDTVPWLRHLLFAAAMVWFLNAFNFMDGIDGLAAAQGLFVAGGVVVCLAAGSAPMQQAPLDFAATVGGICAGFLLLNWSPSRIFMGDVGSSSLGFLLGALCLIFWSRGLLSPWAAAALVSVFLADATTTLVRRFASGEDWLAPHRSHAYQHLARRLRSHAKATSVFMGINVVLVLPLAVSLQRLEMPFSALLWLIAFGAGCMLAWWYGSGRSE